MLGIGAAHRNDPDGIAWKQNKDFESLLKRLNETGPKDGDDASSKVEDDGEVDGKESVNGAAGKKRKHNRGLDVEAERNLKKIRRRNTEDKKSKKSKQIIAEVTTKNTKIVEDDETRSTAPTTPTPYIPRHRA